MVGQQMMLRIKSAHLLSMCVLLRNIYIFFIFFIFFVIELFPICGGLIWKDMQWDQTIGLVQVLVSFQLWWKANCVERFMRNIRTYITLSSCHCHVMSKHYLKYLPWRVMLLQRPNSIEERESLQVKINKSK